MSELSGIKFKHLVFAVFGVLALTASFGVGTQWRHPSSAAIPSITRSAGPAVLQLERIGQLAPLRVHVADVLIAEGEGYRGAWLIKGDALITCDISQAQMVDIDSVARKAKLQLPRLKVTSARVDFAKTKTRSVEKTTWLPWSAGDQGLFRDAAMFHAQQLVEAAASSGGSYDTARKQTELIIHGIYESIGWDIVVGWVP